MIKANKVDIKEIGSEIKAKEKERKRKEKEIKGDKSKNMFLY